MDRHFQLMIPTLFGQEALVATELKRLACTDVRSENGRVFCRGSEADIARINLNLRTGERVLLVLGCFTATDFDTLFERTKALPWEELLPANAAFPVKGYSLNSRLQSVPACQSIIKKAIVSRMAARYGMQQFPEDGPLYQVQFSLLKDQVILSIDTSGAPLYKRGYRADSGVAPLRETLAAAMVLLSHYHGQGLFCDPFCGSGTIPIEAALIAKNRAPGLNRSFAAQKWAWLPADVWSDAVEEALDKEYHGSYEIWGGDMDRHAIELARGNAYKADVEDVVRFEVADARAFRRSAEAGRIVTNPPYGERMLEKEEAEQLYKAFGEATQQLPVGWQVHLITSHPQFETHYGKKADKKRKLYNGMIRCDLYMYLPKK